MAPVTSAVKREHEDDDLSDDSADDSGDDYSNGASGRGRLGRMVGDGAVDYSVTSPGYSSTDSGGASNHAGGFSVAGSSRRATGPRKSRSSVPLTAEEEERRKMRRERNKYAAAKCRQKRVDLTNNLLEETQCLETEQQRLQDEIKSYQQEKEELEFILEAHRLHCGVDTGLNVATAATGTAAESVVVPPTVSVSEHHSNFSLTPAYALPVVKVEGSANEPVILQLSQTVTGAKLEALQPMSTAMSQVLSSSSLSGLGVTSSIIGSVVQPTHHISLAGGVSDETSMEDCVTTVINSADGSKVHVMHKRPSNFGTSAKSVWSARNSLLGSDSVNMFTIGLDSMMDGHTGLTPITGMPAAVQLLATPSGALPVTSIANMSDGQLSLPENLTKVSSGNSPASTRSMVTL